MGEGGGGGADDKWDDGDGNLIPTLEVADYDDDDDDDHSRAHRRTRRPPATALDVIPPPILFVFVVGFRVARPKRRQGQQKR